MRLVSSEDFWNLMCDRRFVRLSRLSGAMAGQVYLTLEAPEDCGMIEDAMASVRLALNA